MPCKVSLCSWGFGLAGEASPESLTPSRSNAPAAPDGATALGLPSRVPGSAVASKGQSSGWDLTLLRPGLTPALEVGRGHARQVSRSLLVVHFCLSLRPRFVISVPA